MALISNTVVSAGTSISTGWIYTNTTNSSQIMLMPIMLMPKIKVYVNAEDPSVGDQDYLDYQYDKHGRSNVRELNFDE